MVNNDWIDIELLEDYLDGKLDSKAMHQLEKQALEDPFIAQALAGLSESPKRASQSVSILQKQLYDRIAQQQITKKDSVFTWQRLSVAAAAAVMFIAVSIMFFMKEKQNRNQQAKNNPRKVEVNMAPSPVPAAIDSASKEVYASTNPAKTTNPITQSQASPAITPGADIPSAASAKPEVYAMKRAMAVKADSTATTATAKTAAPAAAAAVATAGIATVAQAVSSPVDGWAKFDTYITDHNKLTTAAKSGKLVELSFTIDAEGKPTDIKVEKGIGGEFDDEAVRLIKEGPKWEVTKQSGRVSYTIAF